MYNILSDQNKFTVVNLTDDTWLNFAVNQEKQRIRLSQKFLSLTVGQKRTGIVENCR